MSDIFPKSRARLMFDARDLDYDLGPQHPMQLKRLEALVDLLETSDLWQPDNEQTRLDGRAATLEELGQIHTSDYITAVQRLSMLGETITNTEERNKLAELALHYGFGDGDTPIVPYMHDVMARIAGRTLVALSAVMGLPTGSTFSTEDERPLHVFHPAGGWHHAFAERASGFCIYNDIAVAIAHVLREREAKVLYIDFDAHHGDGVQRTFYDDPRVMTVSFHETGRYLFPGTGDVLELGKGTGRGYAVNIPLEPFTEDDSYIEAMNLLLAPLVTSFAPDVIFSVHGCDTHAWDPLTHLHLTTRGIRTQVQIAHHLAHTYCGGRWVAVGGGGYDPYRIVPRAWSLLWAEMSEQVVPQRLPDEWVARWQPIWEATEKQEGLAEGIMGKQPIHAIFPTTFEDQPQDIPAQPRRWEISHTNRGTVALVRQLIIPTAIRHAFPTERHISPLTDLLDLLHLNRQNTPSRSKVLQTKKGTLLLRDFCPPSLVERLQAESGFHAFTGKPEREHQLMRDIAKSPDSALTLAHTSDGEIVGEVTIAPGDEWWVGIENIYEVAVQVSSHWRGMGLAREILAFAFELEALEDMIVFALGLSLHRDTEDMGISPFHYRRLIAHIFASQGFKEYDTIKPDVSMMPANILLARIGNHVDQWTTNQFLNRLMRSPSPSRL